MPQDRTSEGIGCFAAPVVFSAVFVAVLLLAEGTVAFLIYVVVVAIVAAILAAAQQEVPRKAAEADAQDGVLTLAAETRLALARLEALASREEVVRNAQALQQAALLEDYPVAPCSKCGEVSFALEEISPGGRSMVVRCAFCKKRQTSTRFELRASSLFCEVLSARAGNPEAASRSPTASVGR